MRISSYNITDVGYHYIGLRVLAGLPSSAKREEQTNAISRSVLKYASDRALRLLLPEPKGTFEGVGEKVTQELAHFGFAHSVRGGGYELTAEGEETLRLLENHDFIQLRRRMVTAHLRTYENLREVVHRHIEIGAIWRPIVESNQLQIADYIERLLEPTFGDAAPTEAMEISNRLEEQSPKKIEDFLRERILLRTLPGLAMGEALFRGLVDRLISLRLLNSMKATRNNCDFAKTYSPCTESLPVSSWYTKLDVPLAHGGIYSIYISEPDMKESDTRNRFLESLDEVFTRLSSRAGYFDLPEVRDFVCESLKIPEASFDEGINALLDLIPSPITVGLQYEGISGRRKPLVRSGEATQIYNLIRRT